MKFSASSLVKHSARALCYLRTHKPKRNLGMMIEGNRRADKRITGLREMRGCYNFESHELFYCFDEIKVRDVIRLIEHKSVQRQPPEDWYWGRSVLQTTLYHSLVIRNPNKNYYTARFYKGPRQHLVIDKPIRSTLWFGDTKFRVTPTNSKVIVEFFLKKAKASLNYDSAKKWDDQFKYKEFEQLSRYIKVRELVQ